MNEDTAQAVLLTALLVFVACAVWRKFDERIKAVEQHRWDRGVHTSDGPDLDDLRREHARQFAQDLREQGLVIGDA